MALYIVGPCSPLLQHTQFNLYDDRSLSSFSSCISCSYNLNEENVFALGIGAFFLLLTIPNRSNLREDLFGLIV